MKFVKLLLSGAPQKAKFTHEIRKIALICVILQALYCPLALESFLCLVLALIRRRPVTVYIQTRGWGGGWADLLKYLHYLELLTLTLRTCVRLRVIVLQAFSRQPHRFTSGLSCRHVPRTVQIQIDKWHRTSKLIKPTADQGSNKKSLLYIYVMLWDQYSSMPSQ